MTETKKNAPASVAATVPPPAKAAEPVTGSAPVSPVAPQAPTPGPVAAAPRRKRKFGISLYRAWCKRCGICGEFCPTKALRNDELGNPIVVDEDKCVGCNQCMFRCPDFCIEVFERVEPPAEKPAKGKPGADAQPKK